MRNKFIEYLESTGRCEKIIPKLDDWGFFTAPASTNHHCNHEGGLVEHSLNVIEYAIELADIMKLPNMDSVIICSALHDIYKSNDYYVPNYLASGHQSQSKPYKINPDRRLKDHSLGGVLMIAPYIELNDDEREAILFHMGFYERSSADYWRNPCVLAMCIHYADMFATKKENGEL